MEYKIGEVFYDAELHANVQCVKDETKNGCLRGCSHCIYSENYAEGASCPRYDKPCYHSDREDGEDVHFEKVHKPIAPIVILSWMVKNHIETEGMDIIQVDENFDFECFFGYLPDEPVPDGEYLYIYSDNVDDRDMDDLMRDENDDCMPYVITTPDKDKRNDKVCEIYLFKLED